MLPHRTALAEPVAVARDASYFRAKLEIVLVFGSPFAKRSLNAGGNAAISVITGFLTPR
jgi:hypothetical protein